MKTTTPSKSYDGEDIYVGIDVHKRTYVVVVRVSQTIVKKWTTASYPSAFANQLLKFFKGGTIHTVYEAGFSGFGLHRALKGVGIDSVVVHPAAVEVAAHSRVKTDKRDASKLSEQLEAGRLKGIYIPSEVQEQARLLSRTREQLVHARSRVKQQIRAKAHQFGLIAPEDSREMSARVFQELLERSPNEVFTIAIEALWQIWQALDHQINHLVDQLKRQATEDTNEATYQSVPGVGPISARVLSNELGDMSQFKNERSLFSYTGLTPSEHSSGDHVRRGHITKQGNRHLRGILLEIAWRAVRQDPTLTAFFDRLHPRIGKKRAIIAVARKLIGKIRAAFRKGEHYQLGYPGESS
ncbi:MAG: IS110 family transposase [Cyanobacteria bacterium P01_D01_bin.156]